jgi:hypothetical protein
MNCDSCGTELHVGEWPFCGGDPTKHQGYRQTHGETVSYPFTTKAFNGQPITVTDANHDRSLQRQYGVTKRDDVAWIEKKFEGLDFRTGKQKYTEGSCRGLPGQWV